MQHLHLSQVSYSIPKLVLVDESYVQVEGPFLGLLCLGLVAEPGDELTELAGDGRVACGEGLSGDELVMVLGELEDVDTMRLCSEGRCAVPLDCDFGLSETRRHAMGGSSVASRITRGLYGRLKDLE